MVKYKQILVREQLRASFLDKGHTLRRKLLYITIV